MVPMLYILMRTDLDSMNSGKGMAQAAHAANQFVAHWKGCNGLDKWQTEAEGFGTTIVLAVDSEADLQEYIIQAQGLGMAAGVTHDPSYPVRDGKAVHEIPVNTCGFVFSPNGPCNLLRRLSLHP